MSTIGERHERYRRFGSPTRYVTFQAVRLAADTSAEETIDVRFDDVLVIGIEPSRP
jgi:hypothetical protein